MIRPTCDTQPAVTGPARDGGRDTQPSVTAAQVIQAATTHPKEVQQL
jgi:hypothetical protein